ncbi:MAG TPA: hypothetical protein VMA98_09600 [Candidatus Acidoferrales bacterium]|nr:hypothetical protein [Candidatus Acidoferrales bacterium]
MRVSYVRTFLGMLAFAAVTGGTALAGGSIAGGIYSESGNGQTATGGGVLLSTTSTLPLLPATIGLSGFAPLARGGGYAVTVDGTFSFVNNAIGIGYGIGEFGGAHASGTATAFVLHKIAPLTSVELRGYFPMGSHAATAGFLGLRFTL